MNQKRFLAVSFGITWLSWWLLAILTGQGMVDSSHWIYMILFALGGFGPTIAAILVLPRKITVKSALSFIFSRKKHTIGYLILFCGLQAVVFALGCRELNPEVPLYAVPIVVFSLTFFGGGNEELGWRGILQPELEKKLPFPIATVITGGIWAAWHIPLWFIEGAGQQSMNFPLFALYAVVLSFWLAAIYKKSQCVFDCCVFHGFSNMILSLFVVQINWILILGLSGMVILSVWVWYWRK